MKINSRARNIILFFILFLTILGALFVFNYKNYIEFEKKFKSCEDSWCLRISGDVKYEVFVGLEYLLNDTFDRVENQQFHVVNSFGTEYNRTLSGVKLWDILNTTNFLLDNASYIRFQASDGFKSPELPIKIIKNFPELVLIVTHIDGEILEPKENGGDGPLTAAVDYSCIENNEEIRLIFENHHLEFIHNSKYNVKYLNMIIVI